MSEGIGSAGSMDANQTGAAKRSLFRRALDFVFRRSADATLRESLEGVIVEHQGSEQDFSAQERSMLLNIVEFGQLRVDDVMVPRADVIAVDADMPLEDLIKEFHDASHSRLPVYRETLDDPLGMYHIKDLLGLLVAEWDGEEVKANAVAKLRRPVLFVPPSMPAIDLFVKMQTTRMHMALVIDEYGGTDGLVTIEDLVEQVVGELDDEHDVEEGPLLERRGVGRYVADARMPLDEFEELLGQKLATSEDEEDIDTLGGLIFSMVDRVPQRGEIITHITGIEFEIVDADPRRVKTMRIKMDKGLAASIESQLQPSGAE